MFKPIPACWNGYRHRTIVAALGLLLGLPLAAVAAIGIKPWCPGCAELVFDALVVAWAGLWAWSAFRVARWPCPRCGEAWLSNQRVEIRSEEHTSELQSLMRISYAVF